MEVLITGRHLNLAERLKDYTEKKITKLEKFFQQLNKAHLIFFKEKNDHCLEAIITGDGVQFYGQEKGPDHFAVVDLLFSKLEKQIIRYKEKHSSHKVTPPSQLIPLETERKDEIDLKLRQVSNKPIDRIEAYLEMQISENNFILFKQRLDKIDSDFDYLNKNYAVIFKDQEGYMMIESILEKEKNYIFKVYNLKILDESVTSPKIEFVENLEYQVPAFTLEEALQKLIETKDLHLPFYNLESGYLNIIYPKGKGYKVMVPAF